MAKKPTTATFCEVTPLGRRRLDPYNGIFVAPGDKYILDSNKADALAAMGEVEIVKEDVVPPWAKKPEPAPAPASKEK
jgi:hypothetical protein